MGLGDGLLAKKVLKLVMDQLMRQFNPTQMNNKIRRLEIDNRTMMSRINKLEKDSHPRREFVTCESCKCKIKEKKDA